MSTLVPALFVATIVLVVFFAVRAFREGMRRSEAVAAVVSAHGLGYVAEAPDRVKKFESAPFGLGKSRRARDLVWGALVGRTFETFSYTYVTETHDADGKTTSTTHRFQVTWIDLPAAVPTMRLTSDNALLRLLATMGARDLEVESHAFNQQWKVWCADERMGHAILTPRMIERFLEPDVAGRGFVFEGAALMTYASGFSDLSDIESVVGILDEIVALIPPFVFARGPDATT